MYLKTPAYFSGCGPDGILLNAVPDAVYRCSDKCIMQHNLVMAHGVIDTKSLQTSELYS